jgi:release factor glutamine methyltransferase
VSPTGSEPPSALLREAVSRLRAGGVASPESDAAVMLAHVLGVEPSRLPLLDAVTAADAADFDRLVARRAAREPLQHLTGVAGFRYAELAVGPGVFVPRPETELLAGWAVDRARELTATGRPAVVVDLGTGSGAIALAVATEARGARVVAVERDEEAARWAARNLSDAIGKGGAELRVGDMAECCPDLDGAVDVVVSNPPYIPWDAYESVAPEARDHDPSLALWSGEDGLDAIRVVERVAARLLRPGGHVGVEHADAQGEAAPAVFSGSGRWQQVRDHPDLAGRPRYLTARLGSPPGAHLTH